MDSSSKSSICSTCDECCDTGLKVKDFKDDCTEIQFYEWKRIDKTLQNVESILPPDDLITLFDEVRVFKKHIFIKQQQHATHDHLKENLKQVEISLHVDYSGNYVNKQKGEIQSAYFGHDSFFIFTACFHLCDAHRRLVNEKVSYF